MKKRKTITRLAFALHSWLGLFSGVFLLLLGLSGSALVFMKEIDLAVHAKLLRVEPVGECLPLDRLYRSIAKEHPRLAGIAWLNPDAGTGEAYEFRLYQNDGRLSTYDLGMVSLDPYTGRVLRAGNLKELQTGLLHWIYQFHWSFQLGIPGLLLATVFGLTMILSTITGFVIYRKYVVSVLLFRVKLRWKNWRTVSSGFHRIIGVWTLLFNVLIFFTGFWMNKFALDPGYWKKQTIVTPLNTLVVQSVDVLLQKAQAEMPELIVQNVYLPTQPGKSFVLSGKVKDQSPFFYHGNSVAFDQHTGKMISRERLAEQGIWTKVEATFFPLHAGTFGGSPIKLLYVLLGLMPGVLSVTGAMLWWRKKGR